MPSKNEPIAAYLNSFWKFFASIQLTVVILLSLAATSIIGTFIPQNEAPELYLRAYGNFLFRFFSAFDLFDMYHSWWFQLLLIFLALNITVCSIDRLLATWSIIFPRERHFNPTRFRKIKNCFVHKSQKSSDELKPVLSKALSKSFGYIKMEDTPDGFLIFAEKGRLSRLGVYVVHLSVLLLLVGGLIGSFFGFEGFVTIPEGESTDMIQLRNSQQARKLEFEIRCDKFKLSLYPNGRPKEYRSSLTLLENGKEVLKRDIIVNDPLRYKNINIFQSSYGKVPSSRPGSKEAKPPSKVNLSLTSNDSQMTYQREGVIGKPLYLPEGLGTLLLKEFQGNAKFGGQNIGPALVGILTPTQGEPEELLLPLKFPNFDKMRKGKIVISVADQPHENFNPGPSSEIHYYTGLQVTNDPGVGIVYIGFIMMILGCYIAFFTSHKQVFLEVSKAGKKQRLFISGTSNKDKLGMKRKVAALSDKLKMFL